MARCPHCGSLADAKNSICPQCGHAYPEPAPDAITRQRPSEPPPEVITHDLMTQERVGERREGLPIGMPHFDRGSLTLPNLRRFSLKLVVAGSLGGAFGCGIAILLPFLAPWDDFFAWVVSVGLVGIVAGLAAGAARRKPEQPASGWVMTRGLIAAGACVFMLAVVSAIAGGVFKGPFHSPPGFGSAGQYVILSVWFFGLPVALVGLVIGCAVARCIRHM